MKVLIADDDPVCRRLLSAALQKHGCDVRSAVDGREAEALARADRPDVVITDILMPQMNGYDLCRRLKSDAALHRVPVVLLTSLSDPRDVISAIQCRADGFLTKPFDRTVLIEFIENVVRRAASGRGARGDGRIELHYGGESFLLEPDAEQITSLLLSTYDNALHKNVELRAANQALSEAKEDLRQANDDLRRKQDLLDRDLQAAAGIQRSLLPRLAPETPALDVGWKFRPCQHIGGDIFDVIRLDEEHYGFYILDVSGHGVPAALVTVSVAHMMQPDSGVVARPGDRPGAPRRLLWPAEVLEHLAREYPIERFSKFFTMAYAIVNIRDGRLRYSSAGHPPALLLRADGRVEKLDAGGPVIGVGDVIPYEEADLILQPGDLVLLYTDGAVEHRSPEGDLFGIERLAAATVRLAGPPVDALTDQLMEAVLSFGSGALEDDVSLLAFSFAGAPVGGFGPREVVRRPLVPLSEGTLS